VLNHQRAKDITIWAIMGKDGQDWAIRAFHGRKFALSGIDRPLTAPWTRGLAYLEPKKVAWSQNYEDWSRSFPFHVSSSHSCSICVFTGGRHVSRKVSPPDDMRLLGAQAVPPINAWPNSSHLMGEWRVIRMAARLIKIARNREKTCPQLKNSARDCDSLTVSEEIMSVIENSCP